jgi:signal transduction histidine kinase
VKRTLYYLVLAIVLQLGIALEAADAPVQAGKVKAPAEAPKAQNVKATQPSPAEESGVAEGDQEKTGQMPAEEEEPEEAANKVVKGQKDSIDNTYDADTDSKQKQVQTQKDLETDLVSMGLEGAELEQMLKQRRMIVDLVKKGKDYFMKNSLDVACNAFIKQKEFVIGEVYLFIYDTDGFCLAQGNDTTNLWSDFKHDKIGTDEYGSVYVNDFIEKARAGGGWVSYRYNNESKVSYVELIDTGSSQYVIGGGFYPHSKVYAVMNLVKGATRYFRDSQEKNLQVDSIFPTLSYSIGRFVSGDLYIFVLDETGILRVQGERPSLVGSNVWNSTDAKGKAINQEIIKGLNKKPEGIWIDYVSKGAPKKVYAERVTDKEGKNYYIACGYYPDANQKKLQEMVQEGYRHMKKGVEQAFKDFNDHNDTIFHYGDLYLEVFNTKGVCVANGSDQEAIGRSFMEEKDEMGNFYMKKMLAMAKQGEGKGWLNIKLKNAYEWVYLEKVNVGLEEYLITAGLYPISKTESMELLAQDAAAYLRSVKEVKFAFREFIKRSGRFSLGDLEIFVYEPNGICVVNGSDPNYVWKNMIKIKDEVGRPYVKEMINAARRTPARVKYRMNGADALAYVEKVEKGTRSFYVGSSLYTYANIEMAGVSEGDAKPVKKSKRR